MTPGALPQRSAWRRLAGRSLVWLNSTGGPLTERAVRGGSWLLIGDVIGRTGGLVKVVLLAHLIGPHDFGLMGIALVALGWIENFTDTGFKAALVQRAEEPRQSFDTVFTIQAMRSIVLAALLLLGARTCSAFFGHPEAAPLVRVTALLVMLRGIVSPGLVDFRRRLDFRRETAWRASGVLAGLLVAIPAALVLRNAWALALSAVAAQLAETVVSYVLCPYRPRLRVDWRRARELVAFGRWISLSNGLGFVTFNVDSVVVGRLLGAQGLGLYQVAQQAGVLPPSQIGSHVHGVLFPAFSRIEDVAARRRPWLRALTLLAIVALPAAGFASLFAAPLVAVAFGSRWGDIVPLLRSLVWAGAAVLLTRLATALLESSGRPDLPLRGLVLDATVLTILLVVLVPRLGLLGAALAVTGARLAGLCFQIAAACRVTDTMPGELARALVLPLLSVVPLVLATFIGRMPLPRMSSSALAVGGSLFLVGLGLRQLRAAGSSSGVARGRSALPLRRFL
jgi:O-antigen/teichoic acid export membrane protein